MPEGVFSQLLALRDAFKANAYLSAFLLIATITSKLSIQRAIRYNSSPEQRSRFVHLVLTRVEGLAKQDYATIHSRLYTKYLIVIYRILGCQQHDQVSLLPPAISIIRPVPLFTIAIFSSSYVAVALIVLSEGLQFAQNSDIHFLNNVVMPALIKTIVLFLCIAVFVSLRIGDQRKTIAVAAFFLLMIGTSLYLVVVHDTRTLHYVPIATGFSAEGFWLVLCPFLMSLLLYVMCLPALWIAVTAMLLVSAAVGIVIITVWIPSGPLYSSPYEIILYFLPYNLLFPVSAYLVDVASLAVSLAIIRWAIRAPSAVLGFLLLVINIFISYLIFCLSLLLAAISINLSQAFGYYVTVHQFVISATIDILGPIVNTIGIPGNQDPLASSMTVIYGLVIWPVNIFGSLYRVWGKAVTSFELVSIALVAIPLSGFIPSICHFLILSIGLCARLAAKPIVWIANHYYGVWSDREEEGTKKVRTFRWGVGAGIALLGWAFLRIVY